MRRAAVIAFVLASACRPSPGPAARAVGPPKTTFSYDERVGMANMSLGDSLGCLAVFNASVVSGTRVVLVDQHSSLQTTDKVRISEATVVEHLPEECDDHIALGDNRLNLSFYRVRTAAGEWQGNGYVWAILDPAQPIVVRDGNVEGDLDEDGAKEYFRLCPSSEGVHFQVWTGPPLEGRPRWHWYVYAGYDLEPTCTEMDYFGPA